jgi:hypothetical protein
MSFFTKCGEIIDVICGGFTLQTEEQQRLNSIDALLNECKYLSKKDLEAYLNLVKEITDLFYTLPEGRTITANTTFHGEIVLKKVNGRIEVISVIKM